MCGEPLSSRQIAGASCTGFMLLIIACGALPNPSTQPLDSRPALRVRFDEGLQGGMCDDLMGGRDALDGVPDAGEAELAVEEGLDGDFVGCIEHGGQGAADGASVAGEVDGGKSSTPRASKRRAASEEVERVLKLFGTRSGQVTAYWMGKHMSL